MTVKNPTSKQVKAQIDAVTAHIHRVPQYAAKEVAGAHFRTEAAIIATPTGPVRELLTVANIILLTVQDALRTNDLAPVGKFLSIFDSGQVILIDPTDVEPDLSDNGPYGHSRPYGHGDRFRPVHDDESRMTFSDLDHADRVHIYKQRLIDVLKTQIGDGFLEEPMSDEAIAVIVARIFPTGEY